MKHTFFILIIISILASCQDSSYQLSWKLKEGDKLIYLTRMEIINTKTYVSDSNNIQKLTESMKKMHGDTLDVPIEMRDMYNNIIDQSNAIQHISILEPLNDDINLEVLAKRKKQLSQPKYPLKNFIPAESVFFSGNIKPDGSIAGNKKDFLQNYLIKILFELPKNKVSIGDSWSLDIKMYDFSKKSGINKVSLVDIISRDSDEIAVLKYRIKSSDKKQNMFIGRINYSGTAEFNITKGKWEQFEGTLIFTSKVFTEMRQTQKLELTEISEPDYQALIKSYEKLNGTEIAEEITSESENKTKKTKLDEIKNLKTQKCPVIYSVQILATDEPLPLNSKKFRGIPYKIQQRYEPAQPKFKYKYMVGDECSLDGAFKLKDQIIAAGFPKAFIVKKWN
jgi:hypothetical protein